MMSGCTEQTVRAEILRELFGLPLFYCRGERDQFVKTQNLLGLKGPLIKLPSSDFRRSIRGSSQ